MAARDTVVALSSGKGKGAIAVIRVSGPSSGAIFEKCLVSSKPFKGLPARTIGLFSFVNPQSQKTIDQVTAIKHLRPRSFTGEDMVELFCHGSEVVVEKIISVIMDCGAEYAQRGEFTKRAYLNGKFDLVKAEAINQLIESRSDRALESAVHAYFGGYRKSLFTWKQTIKDILRDLEAKIEFPDEDDVLEKGKDNDKEKIEEILKEIKKDINKKQKAEIIEKGINIPIVGISNAGKSSLFNLLLESDRSIVHWEEGTTRDCVSEEIQIGTEKIRLLDTAGLRKTKNRVEMMGIRKTRDHIHNAAIVIWVTPADRPITRQEKTTVLGEAQPRIICIISKDDLCPAEEKRAFLLREKIPFMSACLIHNRQRGKLISFINRQIGKKTGSIEMPGVIQNKRQENVARSLLQHLEEAREGRNTGEEICVRFLQKALEDLGQFVGETTSEEILNSIFSEFCIGK
jgi:tRNA modification GTPase